MVYRNFNLSIIIRLLLIIVTSIWFALELDQPQKAYTKFFILSLIIVQSIFLLRYFNKMNKEIVRFLNLLKADDASYRFSSDLKGNFTELAKILNNTADLLENTRIEKEKQFHFLQFVIEQINIGLIAYDNSGEVQFTNKAFSDLLDINGLKHIDDLSRIDKKLVHQLKGSSPEDFLQCKLNINQSFHQLLLQKKQFRFNSNTIHLVSFQNITAELDQKELDSWQKLIRVLTHEIMNSIAPITNLTYSIRRSLNENIETEIIKKDIIQEAIDDTNIIEKRSNNLVQFVENYRKLTKLSVSTFSNVNVKSLLGHTVNLFKEDLKKLGIHCNIAIDNTIAVYGDEKLLEQALINIIKNAIEALVNINQPQITIMGDYQDDKLLLRIEDNGMGIDSDKIDDIFVPFYTSKESGSGIGLSLVKQIVSLHKGLITVSSELNKGTVFNIVL